MHAELPLLPASKRRLATLLTQARLRCRDRISDPSTTLPQPLQRQNRSSRPILSCCRNRRS